MPYLLLIHEEVGQRQQRTQAEGQAVYDRMLGFAAALKRRGALRAVVGKGQLAEIEVRQLYEAEDFEGLASEATQERFKKIGLA